MTPPDTHGANSAAARDIASLLHPMTNHKAHREQGPLIITGGEGIRIRDESGREYLEAVAGLWCASLGFSNERLLRAATEQMRRLPWYHSFTGRSNMPDIELAEALLARAPVPMSKVFFANSGSEANDTAIKMVWYVNTVLGRPQKRKIIARQRAYHGITAAAASLTGLPANHRLFGLPLPGFLHVGTPHHYHFAEPGESEADFASRLAAELDALIEAERPETVGAFFAEPVMGAGGCIVPPETYFEKIQAVLRKHDVLLVADEVICGFGRTGRYWGSQSFGLRPDILTCAKALSASFLPISAVMVNERVYEALAEGSDQVGTWGHGFTYSGHPVAAAVALETLRIYDEENLIEHAATMGALMQRGLRERFAGHPLVGEVRGVGLVAAVEFAADKAAKRSFDPALKVGPRLVRMAEEEGLILRALMNDSIAFSPPLIIAAAEVEEMLERFGRAVERLTAELRREGLAG
ncbi:aspartate aminotransferase family protein [Pseudoroseomonas sp. WGS1072]|uniref:aspartate aminotransferase family protein n=1 Tax=Roseomonas sp. WGS1072 TaxID=3366816 RepID=UPI003BF3A3DC